MKHFVYYFCTVILLLPWMVFVETAEASTLTNAVDTLSNQRIASTSSHTIGFDITDTSTILVQELAFQFATTDTGSSMPSGLSLSSTTIGTLSTNLGSGWTIDTSSAASGLVTISDSSSVNIGTSASLSVELDAITNQTDINLCDVNNGTLSDTCYVNVTIYSDLGSTVIGTVSAPYTVLEDPSMDFEISPVAAGVTTNGITTNLASTGNSIEFGNLAPDGVNYIAQQLYIKTNAPHGYTVYAYTTSPISGTAYYVDFSPFGATNATWTTPQPWMDPTGATPGSNTGWLAANTTDTRVTGWSGTTTRLFGPISASKKPVAYSSGPDSGTTITVTYALGVNIYQPFDTYTGQINYEVDATY